MATLLHIGMMKCVKKSDIIKYYIYRKELIVKACKEQSKKVSIPFARLHIVCVYKTIGPQSTLMCNNLFEQNEIVRLFTLLSVVAQCRN